MPLYPNADRNGWISFVKFQFYFSIFFFFLDTKLSKHNQNEVKLRRCMVSDPDLALNMYFSDVKT